MQPALRWPFVQNSLTTRRLRATAAATSGAPQYDFYTPWMPAIGVDNLRAMIRAKSASSNLSWAQCIETASIRTDNATSPQVITGYTSGVAEVSTGSFSITSYLGSPLACWFRLGIAHYNNNATGIAEGDVALQTSWFQSGRIVDGRRVMLYTTDTANKFQVLTRWIPAIHVAKVRAAIIVNGVSGAVGLTVQLAQQGCPTNDANPGAWSAIAGTSNSISSGVLEYNTGDISNGDAVNQWIRYGVLYASATSGQVNGILNSMIAVRGT